ncbi:hypothetical protein [Priestia megaterium]|uniref:hypothetical protein n=1 Tax=Priestia megaterium TaxID=1404 RepID=UPI0028779396|nr:hypothetical protein [Priestia megaterium]
MDVEVFTTLSLSYSGLRIGELLALKWFDLNDKRGTLRVTKTYNPNKNFEGYQLFTPKTKGSIRTVKIDDHLVNLLKNIV